MNWLIQNMTWIFSGVGVVIAGALIKYFWNKKASKRPTEKDNSLNQTMGNHIKAKSIKINNNKQNIKISTDKPKQ
jgi:predicted tellurium resistance membrane protein TerC